MLFNNRNYPHPVLGLEDDVTGTIEVDSTVSGDGKKIQIKLSYRLVNSELLDLVEKGKAHYCCHLQCNGTLYRTVFKFDKEIPDTIEIPANTLNGDVELDFLVCASENFTYKSNNFNPDYEDRTFKIEKGDVIAYGGKGKFYANLSPDELKSVSALLRIKKYNSKNGPMRLDYTDDRICIELPEEDFERYRQINDIPLTVGSIHSGIVLPALIEALHFLEADECEEFKTKRWFLTLRKVKDEASSGSCLEIAQNILSDTINKSMPVAKMLVALENTFTSID